MLTDCNDEQAKARHFTVVTLSGIWNDCNDEQQAKARSPMLLTVPAAIWTDFNDLQWLKAPLPIQLMLLLCRISTVSNVSDPEYSPLSFIDFNDDDQKQEANPMPAQIFGMSLSMVCLLLSDLSSSNTTCFWITLLLLLVELMLNNDGWISSALVNKKIVE